MMKERVFQWITSIIFLLAVLASLIVYGASLAEAALPPTSLKGEKEATSPTTFVFQAPYNQATTISGVNRRIETGNGNRLINPSCENVASPSFGWTSTVGPWGIGSVKSDGKQSCANFLTIGTSGKVISQTVTLDVDDAHGILWEGSGFFTATGSVVGARFCVATTDSTPTTTIQGCRDIPTYDPITDGNKMTHLSVPFVLPADTVSVEWYIENVDNANSRVVMFDDTYLGVARSYGWMGLVPDETVFSARVNADGTVLSETEDWINGNATVSDTSTYTIPILNFTEAPACTVTPITNSSVSVDAKMLTVSAVQVQVKTFTSTSSASAPAAFHIECQRQGTDYTAARNRFINFPIGDVHLSAYASSGQSIPDSTMTTVVMDQIVEQSGPISINTTTGVVTVQKPGLYLVTGQVVYTANSTGVRHIYIRDVTNGLTLTNQAVPGSNASRPTTSKVVRLQAGQQIAITTYQTLNATLSTVGGSENATFITVTKIGP